MKKADFIIIFAVLFCALAAILFFFFGKGGETVVITQDNKTVFEVPLSKNNTFDLGSNTVTVADGKVLVTEADCKNQICVNHAAISKKGECIVCLPNKVIVEIK